MFNRKLKSQYKDYLATPSGKKDLIEAIRIKREWRKQMSDPAWGSVETKFVKPENLPSSIASQAVLLTIEPIGLNNMCHITTKWMKNTVHGMRSQLGYNITSCRCGKQTCLELHSVSIVGDKLHDYTADFNDEKAKWFVPLPVTWDANVFNHIYGESRDFISVDTGCRCFVGGARMSEYVKKMTWEEVCEFFILQKKFRVFD